MERKDLNPGSRWDLKTFHFIFRFCKKLLEIVTEMINVFTWEDLPKVNPQTGKYTMAGWIALTLKLIKYNFVVLICIVHVIQCITSMINNRKFIVNCWFPFDPYVSPTFELINILQVSSTYFDEKKVVYNLPLSLLNVQIFELERGLRSQVRNLLLA